MPETKKNTHGNTRKYIFAIKALFTTLLCTFILMKLDWHTARQTIIETSPWMLLAVFVCMFLNIVLCAYKWQILLTNHGVRLGLYRLTKYYFTAMFFSNFLPSIIGGDAYRIYKIYKLEKSKSTSILPVFMERFIGMAALFFVGFVGAVGSYCQTGDHISLMAGILSLSGVVFILLILFLAQSEKIKIFFLNQKKIPEKIKMVFKRLAAYNFKKSKMLFVLFLSILFYIFLVFYRLLLIYAFGEECSVFSLSMIIMVSVIVASIPISINGIGLVEGSFAFLISHFGIGYESAVMVMLMQRFIGTSLSLFGGVAYYFDKDDLSNFRSVENDLHADHETMG